MCVSLLTTVALELNSEALKAVAESISIEWTKELHHTLHYVQQLTITFIQKLPRFTIHGLSRLASALMIYLSNTLEGRQKIAFYIAMLTACDAVKKYSDIGK